MFRRRFPFRRRSTFRRKRGFRPFAGRVRPKYDKVVLFNTLQGDFTEGAIIPSDTGGPGAQILNCGPIVLPHCNSGSGSPATCGPCPSPPCVGLPTCCSQLLTIRLVSNSVLEAAFQDRLTIVSLYGDIWFKTLVVFPDLATGLCQPTTQGPSISQYVSRYAEQVNCGIRKFNQSQYPFNRDLPDAPPAFIDESSPLYQYDWSEARWLWQRNRWWRPTPNVGEQYLVAGSQIGCCPDVTGGNSSNILSDGSGTIDTHVSTTCNPCFSVTEGCPQVFRDMRINWPPTHHFRLHMRRHIALRADDNLDLQIGVRHPVATVGAPSTGWGCNGGASGAGNEEDHTNYYIHARIGAVIRLN